MIDLKPVFNEWDHTYRDHTGTVYPSVTQILRRRGLINTRFYNRAGRNRGTRVHQLTAAVDTGQGLPSVDFTRFDIPLLPYVAGWEEFKQRHVSQFTWVEQQFIHTTGGYAGTIDRVLITPEGEVMLVDIKTGRDEPWHVLQLGGYAMAARDSGMEIQQVAVVRVTRNGGYLVSLFYVENAIRRWMRVIA
ncbi:PD-(D/E)XK nuclease family protein [Alkalispirochaeta alkalica]|uniref:PD-(D/E)XK nuclease family protein n=1 Tax=Alkalispirochaeta alkalica TaxID=46356 RepID=UPI00037E8A7A|nr:PD-(D/E)XK nuclease family protein [Alkalispirochaeta alkalica]